nr:unnamed protein product [Digitaria exilis]
MAKGSAAMAAAVVVLVALLCAPAAGELERLEHPAKNDGSLSVLVVGDWGRKGTYNQSRVAEQMGKVGEQLDIDFVISTGDNFYENGLTGTDDQAFEQSFTDIYTAKSLQKPWYLVLGNHDYRGDVLAQLSPDLDEAIKKSTATWKIAVGHHTMRSVSDHGDTEELLKLLLPVLQANGVNFYINGHDHCLEHIILHERRRFESMERSVPAQ